MRRRSFLGVLATVIGAGCVGESQPAAEETAPTSTTSSTVTEGEPTARSTAPAYEALTRREFGEWHEIEDMMTAYRVVDVKFREQVEHDDHGTVEFADGERLALVEYDRKNLASDVEDPLALVSHVLGDEAHETARGVRVDGVGSVGLDGVDVERVPAWTVDELASGEVGEFVEGAIVPVEVAEASPARVGVTWLAERKFSVIFSISE